MIQENKKDKVSELLLRLWHKQDQADAQDFVDYAITHLPKKIKFEIIKDWCVYGANWCTVDKKDKQELNELIEEGKKLIGYED